MTEESTAILGKLTVPARADHWVTGYSAVTFGKKLIPF